MNKSLRTKCQIRDEIYLSGLMLDPEDSCPDVLIYAFYYRPEDDYLIPVTYRCPFYLMKQLIGVAGSVGNELSWLILDYAMDINLTSPQVIDIGRIYGKLLKIKDLSISYHEPMKKHKKGKWAQPDWETDFVIAEVRIQDESYATFVGPADIPDETAELMETLSEQCSSFLQLLSDGMPIPQSEKETAFGKDMIFNLAAAYQQIMMECIYETKA